MRPKAMPWILGIAFLLTTTFWGQTSVQSDDNANGQASVQTDISGTQASGGISGSAAAESKKGLAAGTTFNAALVTALDSKKAKPGDQVFAHTMEGVRAERKTILPKGTN